jgi:hypothetical protein
MAGYRQFHTQFWKDEWLIELDPLERYLFSYLFTNDLSSISGIFKLPLRVIMNETGLDRDFISTSMQKFQDARKIFYKDGVLWIVNMRKYHKNASPRTMTKVNHDVSEIPDCDVKTAYLYYEKSGIYCIDTVSIPRSEILNVSVSVNESERVSTAAVFSGVPGVVAEATGLVAIPPDEMERVEQIQSMVDNYGHDRVVEGLRDAFTRWVDTRGKNGARYKPTNFGWVNWAQDELTRETVPKPQPKNGKPPDPPEFVPDMWSES